MDEPAEWRALAANFLDLHQRAFALCAIWIPLDAQAVSWSLGGHDSPVVLKAFESYAERGAVLLGQPPGRDAMPYWLEQLKGGPYHQEINNQRLDDDGIVRTEKSGVINSVCKASAEHCYKYETRALGWERERSDWERAANDPFRPRTSISATAKDIERSEEIQHELRLREIREQGLVVPTPKNPQSAKTPGGEIAAASPVLLEADESKTLDDTDPDPIAAERTALMSSFRAKAKRQKIKVTDEIVAKEANPGKWHDRTMVGWWKRNDPRCRAVHDRMIRAVLSRDPASIWPPKKK